MKRVLIADDSALVRRQLKEIIAPLGYEIETVRNGKEAVEKATERQFHVITMDINMPVMDGITALRKIMESRPTPVLMVSSLTAESAQITMEALEAGAVDYICKPGTMNVGREENRADILQKVQSLSRIPPRRLRSAMRRPLRRREREPDGPAKSSSDIEKVVLIGASTGGPGLIEQICAALPSDFPHPVCVVQHMPEQFTAAFAARLDRVSALPVRESANNMELLPGCVYVARGGVHLHFARRVSGKIVLREEREKGAHFFQPSVDELFLSALRLFRGAELMAVLLTGIGDDGAEGMAAVKKAGGYTIGESEETATVYGMPKAAYERGGVLEQLPFPKIVKTIAAFT